MFNDFLKFLKTGKTSSDKDYVNDFLFLFLIFFAFRTAISFIKAYLYNLSIIDAEDFDKLTWETCFSFVLFVPLYEEIIFRGILAMKKNLKFSIPIAMIVSVTAMLYLENSLLTISIIFLLMVLVWAILKVEKIQKYLLKFLRENYLWLVYFSSLAFGLMHVFNAETIQLHTFIFEIGKVISGLYLAYLLTKYNFTANYFMHGVNNSIPFLILWLLN